MIDLPQSRPFRVLFVCTANICRSPMAEFMLRAEIERRGLDWEVSSAGTEARRGLRMDPLAQAELERRSIASDGWTSRRLDASSAGWADLVLTAESRHRSEVVRREPRALMRTFQLVQFARYAAAADPVTVDDRRAGGFELLHSVLVARPRVAPSSPGSDEIADPIRGRARVFRACAEAILAAITEILRPLDEGSASAIGALPGAWWAGYSQGDDPDVIFADGEVEGMER